MNAFSADVALPNHACCWIKFFGIGISSAKQVIGRCGKALAAGEHRKVRFVVKTSDELVSNTDADITQRATLDYEEARRFNGQGLFIGGCPKSGTTLLLSLLDSHPQLVVLPEETFYLEQRRRYRALKSPAARLACLLEQTDLRLLAQGRFVPRRECGSSDARDYTHFDYPRFVNLANQYAGAAWMNDSLLFSEVVRAYATVLGVDWRNCVRWVEKSTSNEDQLQALDELFPAAKLIQVVRDPRAVFASRKKRLISHDGTYTKAHRMVREWNRNARQIPRLRADTSRFLVLHYEALVNNPRVLLQQVCRLGGFDFSERMLTPTRAGKGWEGNSSFQPAFRGIDATTVDQWRGYLTNQEIWWIEFHCRAGMMLANYPLQTNGRFSPSLWLRPLPHESRGGYMRARRASLCQLAGWLKECRYAI